MDTLAHIFAFDVPWWEMALRGTAIYWFLLLVFRFVLRRDVGSMGIVDLLFVVLVADAASNGMSGEYKSVGDGIVLLSTLAAWNYFLDWSTYHSPAMSKFLEPRPEPLVRHGRIVWKALKKELITRDELLGKLREQGVEDLSVVRIAHLESDGEISVLRYDGKKPEQPPEKPSPAGN
jgi:uncharacterized membrane protein YcaP (DUF421 family)